MWLSAQELAAELSTYTRWVHRHVKEFGIRSIPIMRDGKTMACYPPGTLTRLHVEQERKRLWHELAKAKPTWMTAGELAEAIGRSRKWTEDTLRSRGIVVGKTQKRKSFIAHLYPPGALKVLHEANATVKASADWFNLYQLVVYTGRDRQWIERRLAQSSCTAERRRSDLTGKILDFYPPTALALLTNQSDIPAAGNWLTEYALSELIGRNSKWIQRRLARSELRVQGQLRLDDHRVPRMHYPPTVFRTLKAESDHVSSHPVAGDYYSVQSIADSVGRSKLWVQNRLNELGISGEMRQNKKNRLALHYPVMVLELLLIDSARFPQSEDWMTISELARILNVPREAVEKHLWLIEENKEPRIVAQTGRPEWHYPPTALDVLRARFIEEPYDELVDASEVHSTLKMLKTTHTWDEISELLGLSYTARVILDRKRVRKSFARKITALAEKQQVVSQPFA